MSCVKFAWIILHNTHLVKGLRCYVCGKMLPMRETREEKLIKSVLVWFLIYNHKRKSDSHMESMANIFQCYVH